MSIDESWSLTAYFLRRLVSIFTSLLIEYDLTINFDLEDSLQNSYG